MINILNKITGATILSFNTSGNTIDNESLKQKDLSNCSLDHLYFKECDFSGVNFLETTINHCIFEDCEFEGATFNCTLIDFCELIFCGFNKIEMKDSQFSFSDMNKSDFKETNMYNNTFKFSSIYSCCFLDSTIDNFVFLNSNFSYNDFDCNVNNLQFEQCILNSNIFSTTSYSKIVLQNCKVNKTKLKKTSVNNIPSINNATINIVPPSGINSNNEESNCNSCIYFSLLNGFCKYKNTSSNGNDSCLDFKKIS